jgi:hypothetical protein
MISVFFLLGLLGYLQVRLMLGTEFSIFSIRCGALSASFLIMFNLFTYQRLRLGQETFLVMICFSLLFIYFCLRTLGRKDFHEVWLESALILSMISLFIFIANYGFVLLGGFIIFMVSLYILLINPYKINRYLLGKFFLCMCSFIILLNSWWILPSFDAYISGEFGKFLNSYEWGGLDLTRWFSQGTNIITSAWLAWPQFKGTWSFFVEPSLYDWFNQPLVEISLTLPILIAIGSIIFAKKKVVHISFFAVLLLLGWALSVGLNKPFDLLYMTLYNYLPFFPAFRDISLFLSFMAISLPILFGIGIAFFLDYASIGKNIKIISLVILMVSVGLCHYPILSGNAMGNLNPVNIPNSYFEGKKFFDEQEDEFRIAVMPQKWWYERYAWGPDITQNMVPLKVNMFSRPMLMVWTGGSYSPISFELIKKSQECIENGDVLGGLKILQILSTKYIIVSNDIVDPYILKKKVISSDKAANSLRNSKDVKLEKSFDEFQIYSVNNNYINPYIYAASNILLVNDDPANLFNYLNCNNSSMNVSAILKLNDLNNDQKQLLSNILKRDTQYGMSVGIQKKNDLLKPLDLYKNKINFTKVISTNSPTSIIFQKVNPTKYIVHIDEAKNPFMLVFSECYHPQWNIYLDDATIIPEKIINIYNKTYVKREKDVKKFTPLDISYLFRDPLLDTNHFVVNGFANGWYLNKTGSYDIVLYFKPQSIFYIGIIISLTTLTAFLFYVLSRRIMRSI